MNIYVGNLPPGVTADELRNMFTSFGEVGSVDVTSDSYIGSGQIREYGYVLMPSRLEGQAAVLGLQGKTVQGRLLSIIEALPLSEPFGKQPEKRRKRSGARQRGM